MQCTQTNLLGLAVEARQKDYYSLEVICHVFNTFQVYENTDDIADYKHNRHQIPLIMESNYTRPGYTLLKLYDRKFTLLAGLEKFCDDIQYGTFISSKLFREKLNYNMGNIHGPCSYSDPLGSCDSVCSFYSKKWIMQADDWIHRSRVSWPCKRLIERIVANGVLFVPIGCKNSPREDMEFRISFNVAEKLLVFSFNHTQLFCYSLLKLILKLFIKPQHGDLLCSYFLKNIMFWECEKTIDSAWQPHNLLRCFDRCFKTLVYCVKYSTCLHYFIPELDLFEGRFGKSEHETLTSSLQSLQNAGLESVLQKYLLCPVKCLRNFFHQSPTEMVPYASALPTLFYMKYCQFESSYSMRHNKKNTIRYRSLHGSLHLPGKQICAIIFSIVNQTMAQCIPLNESYNVSNKQRYRNHRKCLNHILQGIHHDVVSGWLILASYFYTCKQYQHCLYVFNYCLHKCTPDKILLDRDFEDLRLQLEFNIEMKQHVKHGLLSTCQRRVVNSVWFDKQSLIIPTELSTLVADKPMSFPPVVFAHFLHTLCLHHLKRNRDKMNALRDLETTIKHRLFIPNDKSFEMLSDRCLEVARQHFTK